MPSSTTWFPRTSKGWSRFVAHYLAASAILNGVRAVYLEAYKLRVRDRVASHHCLEEHTRVQPRHRLPQSDDYSSKLDNDEGLGIALERENQWQRIDGLPFELRVKAKAAFEEESRRLEDGRPDRREKEQQEGTDHYAAIPNEPSQVSDRDAGSKSS